MTAQYQDQIHYNGGTWDLAGINGEGLFEPAPHGFRVRPPSTACWRGYICTYRVVDNQLFLDSLDAASDDEAPVLLGAPPQPPIDGTGFTVGYREMAAPIAFDGGLLLARDFIRELYVHMGFHPAWKYRHITELILEQGRVLDARDCSADTARVRERLLSTAKGPVFNAPDDVIAAWIEQTFTRSY